MKKTAKTIPARLPDGQAKNVDEYLHALPEAMRATLEKVRQAIKAAALRHFCMQGKQNQLDLHSFWLLQFYISLRHLALH